MRPSRPPCRTSPHRHRPPPSSPSAAWRQISAEEAVAAAVGRAERADARLNAVAVPLYEEAVAAARRLDERIAALPLAGVPITVKESFEIAGTPRAGEWRRCARPLAAATPQSSPPCAPPAPSSSPRATWRSSCGSPRPTTPSTAARQPAGARPLAGRLERGRRGARRRRRGAGRDRHRHGRQRPQPAHCCGIAALKPTAGRLSLAGTLDERLFAGFRLDREPARHLRPRPAPTSRSPFAPSTPARRPARRHRDGLRVGVFRDNGIVAPSRVRAPRRRAPAEAAAARAGAHLVPFTPPAADHALALFDAAFRADGGDGLERDAGRHAGPPPRRRRHRRRPRPRSRPAEPRGPRGRHRRLPPHVRHRPRHPSARRRPLPGPSRVPRFPMGRAAH